MALACLVPGVNYSRMIARVQDVQRDCEQLEQQCVELVTFVDK